VKNISESEKVKSYIWVYWVIWGTMLLGFLLLKVLINIKSNTLSQLLLAYFILFMLMNVIVTFFEGRRFNLYLKENNQSDAKNLSIKDLTYGILPKINMNKWLASDDCFNDNIIKWYKKK
jgi:hypothetical protein